MAPKAPFTDLEIAKAESGFYESYSLPIALISKGIMVVLVLWALIFPISANGFVGHAVDVMGVVAPFWVCP